MDRRWLTLLAIGVILTIIVVGWDVYLGIIGFKGRFTYSTPPISTNLYQDVQDHFESDPYFLRYQVQAEGVDGIDFFQTP